MPEQINIEKIENSGTINFYVNDEKSAKDTKKIVDIAAVDMYSTPYQAEVGISPFGKQHFRVSCRVTEKLNNQTIYQKYLTYKDEKEANEIMKFIVSTLEEIKDDAEVNLRHSSYIAPLFWKKLSDIKCDMGYHDTTDDSIKRRFNNNQFDTAHNGYRYPTEPQGWVGDGNNLVTHTKGVVSPSIADIVGVPTRLANSIGFVKTASDKKSSLSNSLKNLYRFFKS